MILKKVYCMLFTLIVLTCSCSYSHQKIVITKDKPGKSKESTNTYANWKEAVANYDFSSAGKFPLSASEKKLVNGYELLLHREEDKAERVLKELWRTDPSLREDALSILYKYYFYHTQWDKFMGLVEMMGKFPAGYDMIKDYRNFPGEKILFPTAGDNVSVPIKKFNRGKTPVIVVQVNGKKKSFIVDTGVSISAVSSSVAKECGITRGSHAMKMRDANNAVKKNAAIPAYIKELKINDLTILNHPIFVSGNLNIKILGITVYKIDGIIGWSLLQKLKVRIDYPNKHISLGKPVKETHNKKMLNGIESPFITVTSANGNRLFLHLDTGANKMTLSDNAKKKIDRKVSSEKSVTSFSVNKNKREKAGIIKDFSFFTGNHKFNLSEIEVTGTKVSPGSLIELNGRIGNHPFLNGAISFDYQNGIFEYSGSMLLHPTARPGHGNSQ